MMEQLSLMLLGAFLLAASQWLIKFASRVNDIGRRKAAEKELEKNGLKAELYLATIGTEDHELRNAMDYFAFRGYLILNKRNEVVGRLCPKVKKGPHLRLVVSNEPPGE